MCFFCACYCICLQCVPGTTCTPSPSFTPSFMESVCSYSYVKNSHVFCAQEPYDILPYMCAWRAVYENSSQRSTGNAPAVITSVPLAVYCVCVARLSVPFCVACLLQAHPPSSKPACNTSAAPRLYKYVHSLMQLLRGCTTRTENSSFTSSRRLTTLPNDAGCAAYAVGGCRRIEQLLPTEGHQAQAACRRRRWG